MICGVFFSWRGFPGIFVFDTSKGDSNVLASHPFIRVTVCVASIERVPQKLEMR